MRGLVKRSEGLRAALAWALAESDEFGWPGLANTSEGSGGQAGPARSATAQPLADTAHCGLERNIPGCGLKSKMNACQIS